MAAISHSKMFCGTAASPLEASGHLIIQAGSDVHGGQILALDLATGATKWEWRGAGPGYASPIVINLDGTAQVVTLSERSVVGLNAATGAELWSAPFPDEWHENIVTPVWTGSHLIVSGTRQGTHAYALQRANGRWRANQAWNNTGVAMYMSSPVCGDGLIYGHSAKNRGQFVALDAQTGATRWASDGREGEHASVLLTPRHIVYLTQSGDLTVVRRHSEKFEAERRYKVSSVETLAMPVLLGSDLLVRNATALVRLTPAQKNRGVEPHPAGAALSCGL